MTLDKVKRGDLIKITAFTNAGTRQQAVRMGVGEGAVLTCAQVIPAGPVVLCKNRQELAIGRLLARSINVELLARMSEAGAVAAPLKSETC